MQIATTTEQRVALLFVVKRLHKDFEVITQLQSAGVYAAPKES